MSMCADYIQNECNSTYFNCTRAYYTHFYGHILVIVSVCVLDFHRFSRVSLSPFTEYLLRERRNNVPTSRVFNCSGVEFKWETVLSKLQNLCQNALHCPYVCKTSLHEVCK